MHLFHVQPDDANWGNHQDYEFDASHTWGLPGIRCSVCAMTWSTTGVAYPAVDLSILPSPDRYGRLEPVTVEEFQELRAPIIRLLGANLALPPGTDFGPLVGKAWGKFGDFAWVNPWTMLIRHESWSKLSSIGVRLPEVVTPKLGLRSKLPPKLLEFQVEPLASLSATSFSSLEPSPCPVCGHDGRKAERIIVRRTSIPSYVDLFRLRDFPTVILATEEFAEAVQNLSMTDISMVEVKTGE